MSSHYAVCRTPPYNIGDNQNKMILEILLFILTIIVVYYLYSYKRLHRYFDDKGVKYLPGWPIFGNSVASTFQRKHILEEFGTTYAAFPDDKYVGFFEYTVPILMIRDPELIRNITVKDFEHFTDHRAFFSEELDPLVGGSLIFMKGDRWRDMRATLSPAFTSSKMKYMLPFVKDISNNIVDYLNSNQNIDVDAEDLMRRYANDVIASAGFGVQVNSLKDRDNKFYTAGNGIFDFSLGQQLIMMMFTLCPKLIKKLDIRFFSDRVYNFFTQLVQTTMEYRIKEKVTRPDMIQLLMETKKEWTPIELTAQVFIFFTAGFDTSASSLTMTIHELALNPHIQDKLYQECRKFKEEKELTFDNLSDLKYLDAVINESLRIWCPAIILDRTCIKAYELPPPREGGLPYTIKPGDVVYNLVNQVQLDPKYWPDPYKFDPERFSEENKHNIKPYTFMPFGVGPRACVGNRFALMEIKVLLFHLILNFKILKTAKTSNTIKMVPKGFNIRVIGGTHVQFEKRGSE